MGGVAGDKAEDEVAAAADHVALAQFGPVGDRGFELGEHAGGLALQADQGEEGDRPADERGLEDGAVAADDALLLEAADAAQAGRGGNADAAGELDIGHAAVRLQLAQDAAVGSVQFHLPVGEARLGLLSLRHPDSFDMRAR